MKSNTCGWIFFPAVRAGEKIILTILPRPVKLTKSQRERISLGLILPAPPAPLNCEASFKFHWNYLTGVVPADGTGACPVAPADGTGACPVAPADGTGACPVAPADGTGVKKTKLDRFPSGHVKMSIFHPRPQNLRRADNRRWEYSSHASWKKHGFKGSWMWFAAVER